MSICIPTKRFLVSLSNPSFLPGDMFKATHSILLIAVEMNTVLNTKQMIKTDFLESERGVQNTWMPATPVHHHTRWVLVQSLSFDAMYPTHKDTDDQKSKGSYIQRWPSYGACGITWCKSCAQIRQQHLIEPIQSPLGKYMSPESAHTDVETHTCHHFIGLSSNPIHIQVMQQVFTMHQTLFWAWGI